MKKRNSRPAFTLAETLITLTIIGVIAAITVPALVQRTNKQEYAAALQKAYSTLSQAANMIIAENGSPKGVDSWGKDIDTIYEMFKKHLNNVKECGKNDDCWNDKTIKYLNTSYSPGSSSNLSSDIYKMKLITADGMQIMLHSKIHSADCDVENCASKNVCAVIYVDINGDKKPNQWGRDYFAFALKENGIYPAGCGLGNYFCHPLKSNSEGAGYGCACRVFREGAMNY